MIAGARAVRRLARREIKEVHFPAELGPSYVYSSPEAIHGAVENSSAAKRAAAARVARKRGKREEGRRSRQEEEEEEAKHVVEAEAARQRRPGPGRRSGRSGGEGGGPQGQRRLPRLLPDPAARRAPTTSKTTPMNTSSTRASTTSRTKTRSATAPTGWWSQPELPDGIHYFGLQGIQGWSDPPILDNPSETQTIARPGIRNLRRRRSGQAGRLASRREHLLGLERPAQHADQRPDGRASPARPRCMCPNQKAASTGRRRRR